MNHNLEQCYKILGLELGASLEEVNQAYKDLAFIWHPDRLPKDNERLIQKSVEKLQEINYARDILRSAHRQKVGTPSQASSSPQAETPRQPAQSHYYRDYSRDRERQEPQSDRYGQDYSRDRESHRFYNHYNSGRAYHRPYERDLKGVDFSNSDLREKDLSGRNLQGANLSHADLSDSFLHKIDLESANLTGANLFRANLLEANLRKANLRDVNLIGADLSGADLSGADLTGAKVGFNKKIMVKLTGTKLTGTILPDGSVYRD